MTPESDSDDLAATDFHRYNTRLQGIAYRMLGSWADAEDVVAESWLRWHERRPEQVDSPLAWLTTVATRLSIDFWRTQQRRREDYIGPWLPEPIDPALLPDESAEQRQSLAFGLLHLMERLTPDERAVYVLRYAFDHPFIEIAQMLGRTPASCRQLGRRAREKIDMGPEQVGGQSQEPLLAELVSAVTSGQSAKAVALVTNNAVLIPDSGGKVRSALRPILGADKVVRFLMGIARKQSHAHVELVAVNAGHGLRFTADGETRLLIIEADGDRIHRMHLLGNPNKLTRLPTTGSVWQ